MAIGALAKIGGKSRYVSQWAAKVVKGADACGIYRATNGFSHRLTGFYSGPSATLTESFKRLKDGRTITQKLWTWPNGSTRALTSRSDGFLSVVGKDANGKRIVNMISRNNQHLVEEGTRHVIRDGKSVFEPYANYVTNNNLAMFRNRNLIHTSNSPTDYFVRQAREGAVRSFNCIGQPGLHLR